MDPIVNPKKWYQKKAYIIPSAIIGVLVLVSLFSNSNSQQTVSHQGAISGENITVPNQVVPEVTPVPQLITPITPAPQPTPQPAPNGTYKNVDGNQVPSPYKAPSAPSGASAQCRDGSYSFSQHRSGTCSHHGGVMEWY